MAFWQIHDWPVPPFEYKGETHKWTISYQETGSVPHVFQVNDDKNYFVGQLIYSAYNDTWSFYYLNKDNVQQLADMLSDLVIKAYQ